MTLAEAKKVAAVITGEAVDVLWTSLDSAARALNKTFPEFEWRPTQEVEGVYAAIQVRRRRRVGYVGD